ncbi:MAG TPA: hypothetical protein VGC79_31380, partial [Polyangiaceae bacterium]
VKLWRRFKCWKYQPPVVVPLVAGMQREQVYFETWALLIALGVRGAAEFRIDRVTVGNVIQWNATWRPDAWIFRPAVPVSVGEPLTVNVSVIPWKRAELVIAWFGLHIEARDVGTNREFQTAWMRKLWGRR